MRLPNDVARCADALKMNCQWRHNCKRWVYRINPRGQEVSANQVVWANFAAAIQPNKKCEHQLRID